MSLRRLANDIRRLPERIELAVVEEVKDFALSVVDIGTINSPVDTSRLISNYHISVGSSSEEVFEAAVEGRLGSTSSASRSVTLLEAEADLAAKTAIGQDVYVVNNTEYLLERNQADGFLDRIFSEAVVRAQSRIFRF